MAQVLVVDTQRDLREVMSLALTSAGHEVVEAADGIEALVAASRGRFDIVLLDVEPEGIRSDAVARVVRDLGARAVIAMAGRADENAIELLAAGVVAVLPKPFGVGEMMSLVHEVLRALRGSENGWPTDVRRLSSEDLARIGRLSASELDALPFGVIALDGDGRIVEYNAYESRASTHPRQQVVGMSFAELAPCSAVRKFASRLERALRGEPLDAVLRFVFPHGPALSIVSVRFYRHAGADRVWLFVSKRPISRDLTHDGATLQAARMIPR